MSYGDKHDESSDPGRHTGYKEPVFAWMPSIGVSQLISLKGDLFPTWKGDLVVASLRDQSIFRLRIRHESVAFAERIRVAGRVRDLIEARDGKIVLMLDGGAVGVMERDQKPEQGRSKD